MFFECTLCFVAGLGAAKIFKLLKKKPNSELINLLNSLEHVQPISVKQKIDGTNTFVYIKFSETITFLYHPENHLYSEYARVYIKDAYLPNMTHDDEIQIINFLKHKMSS